MKIRSDKQRIRDVLTQTIVSLCHTGLSFNKEMTVEGLLGITLDNNDVFLVNIKEVLEPAFGTTADSPGSPRPERSSHRDRDQRRASHSQKGNKRKVVCLDDDEDSGGSDLMVMGQQSAVGDTHEEHRVPPQPYLHQGSPHSSRTSQPLHHQDFSPYSTSSRSAQPHSASQSPNLGANHQSRPRPEAGESFTISDSQEDSIVKEESGPFSSCQLSSTSRPPSSVDSGRSEQGDTSEQNRTPQTSASGDLVTPEDDVKIKSEPDYLATDYGALQPMEDTGGLPDFSSVTADESVLSAADVGFDPSLLAHAQAGPSQMMMPGPMPSTSDAGGTQAIVRPKITPCGDDHYQIRGLEKDSTTQDEGHARHECPVCHRSYGLRYNMLRHLKGHYGKGYQCIYCGKVFTRTDVVRRHVILAHAGQHPDTDDDLSTGFITVGNSSAQPGE